MSGFSPLSESEQFVLLAVVRLGDDAYGIRIRREIEAESGRRVSVAAVYATLERLEQAGFVVAWLSDPIAERGGRARKHFRIQRSGVEALRAARAAVEGMWRGVRLPSDADCS